MFRVCTIILAIFLLCKSSFTCAIDYAYLGNDRGIARLREKSIENKFIYVDTRDYGIVPHLIMSGFWEQAVTDTIKRELKLGEHILEVGANFGFYTVLMANIVGESGKIYSFECNPNVFSLLTQTISINGYNKIVSLYDYAASHKEGKEEFSFSYDQIAGGNLIGEDERNKEKVHVKMARPSVILGDKLNDITFIRMDAEGSEALIIFGLSDFIKNKKDLRIVMEFSAAMQKSLLNKYNIGDIKDFYKKYIYKNGYSVYEIKSDASLRKLSLEDLMNLPHSDVLIKRD